MVQRSASDVIPPALSGQIFGHCGRVLIVAVAENASLSGRPHGVTARIIFRALYRRNYGRAHKDGWCASACVYV